MIDKALINDKLDKFFKITNPEEFLKIFIISFLFDKVNYLESIIGYENCLNMLDKWIYNLENNISNFKKLEKYHSIFVKYDFNTKTLNYFMTNNYNKGKSISKNKKDFLIKEFKIMMYKEFEVIINIYSSNGKIISNGFYIENMNKYPDYEGNFSNIIDVFADDEACKIINLSDKIKIYVDENKKYYVYSKHISLRNLEVLNYVCLWRKFIDEKLLYFSINNPKKYSEKLINDFNSEYNYVLNGTYKFLLDSKDVFSLIENYLLHIRNRVNIEYNVKYHKDLSYIFSIMNRKKHINNISEYLLHNSINN